jgi:predicted nucleic acid-binding Zn ribbon protein
VRRRGRGKPENLGKLVPRVLEDLGIGGSARIMQLVAGWEAAVGADVARHCRPLQFRDDLLEVEVDSSVWCQQLKLQEPQLIASLSEALGDVAPKQMRFRLSS